MLFDVPLIHCLVDRMFLAGKPGFEECYVFAATCIPNRPLLFTVHTEKGAVFSRLPIHALRSLSPEEDTMPFMDLEQLMPWGCVGHRAMAIEHSYLKGYDVNTPRGTGRYLFTVDYFDGSFSEDPTQHKTHNVVELRSGYFGAWPNNMCQFLDRHFTGDVPISEIDYKRQTTFWRTG